tara:strand:- start:91 stop:258 length:168 start_codon:yes stop_codon:yes gene_type:complete
MFHLLLTGMSSLVPLMAAGFARDMTDEYTAKANITGHQIVFPGQFNWPATFGKKT